MNIRIRLPLFFLATLSVLCGIGWYATSTYHELVGQERQLIERTNDLVEQAHHAEVLLGIQLNTWKNILLRGSDPDHYHDYLQTFYKTERAVREAIEQLRQQSLEIPGIAMQIAWLASEHLRLGRRLRDAIRLFNTTDANAGQITDRLVMNVETVPGYLLTDIVVSLREYRDQTLATLGEQHGSQENSLISLVILVFIVAGLMYTWVIDRNIARPAEHAAYLSDVIDKAQQAARFGTWDWDFSTSLHYWSDSLYEILGVGREISPSLDAYLQAVHEDDREQLRQVMTQAMTSRTPFDIEARVVLSNGSVQVVQQRGQTSSSGAQGQARMTCIISDITRQKHSEERLRYLTNYDILTELPNRKLFEERLGIAIAQAEETGTRVALLYFDLDQFKAVNEVLGHTVGDELIRQAAQRIRRLINRRDSAARMSGDEFTVVLGQFEDTVDILPLVRNLLNALSEVYTIDSHEVFVTASMGISLFPDDGGDVDILLRKADAAMYLAKNGGRNTYHFFTEELNARAHERLRMESSLRLALQREEFQLYFQPQIDLGSGKIIGAEALLRWLPDDRSVGPVVGPDRFIPILEETGLIVPVGKWVIEQACTTAMAWQQLGYYPFCIAVNLSPRQLRQDDLVESITEILQRSGLSPSCLEVELTESSLVESGVSLQNLKRLEKLGVGLAIDDFGTGYSSLSYLKKYAVDVLKIDRSFIQDIHRNSDDDAVTSAIVALSHRLGMKVTAEGVESIEQLEFLRKLGCDYAQGFLIAHPMPRAEFERWMLDQQDGQAQNPRWKGAV